MNKYTIAIIAVCATTISAFAPPDMPAVKLKAPTEVEPTAPVVKAIVTKEPFAPDEWIIELSANFSVPQPRGFSKVLKTDAKHGDVGASFGVTRFVTRNFGIGLESGVNDAENIEGVDHAGLFIIARTPMVDILPTFELVKNIAPYAIVGVGHDFHTGKQQGFVGGGVEYRITARVGVYFVSGYKFDEQDNGDETFTRLGVRIAF